MFRRKPKLTPQEHARALDLVLRELEPAERRGAEALLARMTDKDRDRTEGLLIKHGAKQWQRLEAIMLRFGELAPVPDEQTGEDAPQAPEHRAAPITASSLDQQREQANRALGR